MRAMDWRQRQPPIAGMAHPSGNPCQIVAMYNPNGLI